MFLSVNAPTVASVLSGQTTKIQVILDQAFEEGDEFRVEQAKQVKPLLDYVHNDLSDELYQTREKIDRGFKSK